ncbi:MAG TPA: response regulator [Phycisphaerae bacterium]|nr:response regulator [Phycisphaerae bacterium]HRY70226.1 response regulator [Phycisphaerae bacterium]HSA27441.1 response regulator [Phycisphaerae bacterium]
MVRRDWKVLLVDDDPDDHVLIRDIVQAMGCAFDWADRYERGLERIAQRPYDVCLIDYRLGDRDGLEFIREVLARGYQAPMILLTGQGDLLIDMKAMEAGAVDYLEKGRVDLALLERSIRYAIDRKQTEAVLANRAKELAYTNATIREFADVAAVELRAPLQEITETLHDLQSRYREQLAPEANTVLTRGIEAAERMRRLVDELTVLSGAAAEEVTPRLPEE